MSWKKDKMKKNNQFNKQDIGKKYESLFECLVFYLFYSAHKHSSREENLVYLF